MRTEPGVRVVRSARCEHPDHVIGRTLGRAVQDLDPFQTGSVLIYMTRYYKHVDYYRLVPV